MPTNGLVVPRSFLRLVEATQGQPFTPKAVEELLGRGMKTYGAHSRLAGLRWLFRLGRGRYATVDPIVRLTPGAE